MNNKKVLIGLIVIFLTVLIVVSVFHMNNTSNIKVFSHNTQLSLSFSSWNGNIPTYVENLNNVTLYNCVFIVSDNLSSYNKTWSLGTVINGSQIALPDSYAISQALNHCNGATYEAFGYTA